MSKHHEGKTKQFSLSFFVSTVLVTLGGLFAALFIILWFISIDTWKVQFESFTLFIAVVLSVHLINSFIEFLFHRYVLHAPVVPFLAYFYKQHTLHHSLTRVRPKKIRGSESAGYETENRYPILEEDQHEASFFPPYALLVFALLATPLFALGQWLWPSLPIFVGGYSAIAFSLVLYEVLHAIEHWPVEKWKPLLDHERYGSFWKIVYGFHLRHHADINSNESISGFLGIPLPDILFGTYKKPDSLYENGELVDKKSFESPRPVFFIRWLDKLAKRAVEKRRSVIPQAQVQA